MPMIEALSLALSAMNRDELVAALLDGTGLPDDVKGALPKQAPDRVQMATTGKTGRANVVEAVDFCFAVSQRYRALSVRPAQPRVLDFGCGWGRVTRTFLSVTRPGLVTGADVRGDAVDLAQSLAPDIDFVLIDPRPPALAFGDASFDLVVGYSVFSHLSEDVAQAWIEEFARIVAPGGLVCITTRPRVHLLNAKGQAKNTANLSGHLKQYATMLDDFDAAIARYDAGEFVYVPTGGGGMLTPDFFGEAIVPKAYVEKEWQACFDLVEWVDTFSEVGTQPIIILRRKGA